ncbi:hypothetical protein ACFL59_14500, partial [Planctomycetota bacterium]
SGAHGAVAAGPTTRAIDLSFERLALVKQEGTRDRVLGETQLDSARGNGTVSATATLSLTGNVRISYKLRNEAEGASNVAVEFSRQGSEFQPATEISEEPSEGVIGLKTSEAGEVHVFLWDADEDLGTMGAVKDVRVRVVPAGGTAGTSPSGVVGNDAPQFQPNPVEVAQRGLVEITGSVTDSTGDEVDLRVEVVGMASTATVALGSTTDLLAEVNFAWDSSADIPHDTEVRLRITPLDDFATGTPVDLQFQLDNNDPPSILVSPVDRQTGDVRVNFRLDDDHADPASLKVRFTAQKGQEAIGPQDITAATSLTDLPSSKQGTDGFLVWRSGTDLGFSEPGGVVSVTLELTPADADGGGIKQTVLFRVGAEAPTITMDPITSVQRGAVLVRFRLFGPEDPADVDLTFTAGGSSVPRVITLAEGSVSGLATSPVEQGGVGHTVFWNSVSDVGFTATEVTLRAVPKTLVLGAPIAGSAATMTIAVDNNDRVSAQMTSPAVGETANARNGAAVPIGFLLIDLQGDEASVDLEIDVGDGRGLHLPPGGHMSGLEASPDGARHTFNYRPGEDGVRPEGGDRAVVRVQVTPTEDNGTVGFVASSTFALDLNEPPTVVPVAVDNQPLAGGMLLRGAVPFEVQISDAEGDGATVVVHASNDGGENFSTLAIDPPVFKAAGSTTKLLTFQLDTTGFGIGGAEDVIVRLTPRDQTDLPPVMGEGAPVLILFRVDNEAAPAPVLISSSLSGTRRGRVEVPFTLSHRLGDPCDVYAEFSAEDAGGPYREASNGFIAEAALPDAPLSVLPTRTDGGPTNYVFSWDTLADVGTQRIAGTYVRFKATNRPEDPADVDLTFTASTPSVSVLSIDNSLSADLVVGKPDPQIGGIDNKGVERPSDVEVGAGRVWICDQTNHRVLQFNTIPMFSNQGADVVLGQSDFTSGRGSFNSADLAELVEPVAVAFDPVKERLYVSDVGGGVARVLVWAGIPQRNGQEADLSIHFSRPVAGELPFLSGLAAFADDLYVSDASNNRVLQLAGVQAIMDSALGSAFVVA